jgi:hypothetical protein
MWSARGDVEHVARMDADSHPRSTCGSEERISLHRRLREPWERGVRKAAHALPIRRLRAIPPVRHHLLRDSTARVRGR